MRNKTLYSVCSMLQNSDFRAYIEFCLRAKNEIRNELSRAELKNLQLEPKFCSTAKLLVQWFTSSSICYLVYVQVVNTVL